MVWAGGRVAYTRTSRVPPLGDVVKSILSGTLVSGIYLSDRKRQVDGIVRAARACFVGIVIVNFCLGMGDWQIS